MKSALNKVAEHKKLAEEGRLSTDNVAAIGQRTDIISYATLAEINHFQHERVAYFKSMMETFLTAQIAFYQQVGFSFLKYFSVTLLLNVLLIIFIYAFIYNTS